MTHLGTVQLETDRLILRRFVMEDAEAMFNNWASDDDVSKYLTWPTHASVEVSRSLLTDWVAGYEKPDAYRWAIELKDCGTVIGDISVVRCVEKVKMVSIGYCIGKAWWRQGYVTEALVRVLKFFFEEVKMNRVEAYYDPRNPNSGKVMEKAGLRYEGTNRETSVNNQGICDEVVCAMLAKDYFGHEN